VGANHLWNIGTIFMNHEVERYEGELKILREKVEVYEKLLHKIQLNAQVIMDHEVVKDLLSNICNWSYAHRQGNGELSDGEQDELIRTQFEKLLKSREPWTVRQRKLKEANEEGNG
jgi:hypothetical protein